MRWRNAALSAWYECWSKRRHPWTICRNADLRKYLAKAPEPAMRYYRCNRENSFCLVALFGGTDSVGARSLFHNERFPCEDDLASLDQGINCVVDNWHVVTPLKRGVVILRQAACNFARARRARRSTCDKAQNRRHRILTHSSASLSVEWPKVRPMSRIIMGHSGRSIHSSNWHEDRKLRLNVQSAEGSYPRPSSSREYRTERLASGSWNARNKHPFIRMV